MNLQVMGNAMQDCLFVGLSDSIDPILATTLTWYLTLICSGFSCSFWSLNTSMFPDFLTIFTTILDLFGGSSGSIFGSQMTLYQGLTSTRPDAYGSLLRQGSAAILNSYTSRSYPYTPFQVKSQFRSALVSQQAAAVMAVNFENANHGYSRRN
jgi:hypothetical protein